jgi:hypothetical protein
VGRALVITIAAGLLGAVTQAEAPGRVEPVRVCELLAGLEAWRGKTAAVIGRYSFRDNGRFMSEDACESHLTAGSLAWPDSIQLTADPAGGPKLPDGFDVDPVSTARKLKETRKATALGKFRFGSLEYDRWAIVYGRVEPAPGLATPPTSLKPGKNALEPAPLRLIYRGDGMIFVIPSE